MTTTVLLQRQTLRVSGTTKVTFSAIEDDPASLGVKRRSIRIHTDDPATPALEILIDNTDAEKIRLPAPETNF